MTIDPTIAVTSRRRVAVGRIGGVQAPSSDDPGRQGLQFDALAIDSVARPTRRPKPPTRLRRSPRARLTDPTAVVMAVERAQLAMQIASQIRTKAVEAAQNIFQTQV